MRISTPLAPAAPISPHAPGRARTAGVAHGVASALLLSAAGRSLATPVGASPVPLEGLAPPHLNGPLAGRGATPAVGPNPSTFAGCTYDYAPSLVHGSAIYAHVGLTLPTVPSDDAEVTDQAYRAALAVVVAHNMWPPRIDAWAEDANRTVVRVSLFGEDGDEQAVVMTDELPLLSGGPLRCPMGVGLGAKDEITGDEVLYAPLFEKALAMTHGGYDGVAAMTVAQHAKALANVGGKTVDQPDGATLKAGMEQPTVFKVRTRKQQVKGMHACDLDAHRPHPPLADDWMGYIYATNTAPLPCTLDPYVIYKDGILSAIDAVGTIMEWRPRGDKGVPAFVLYSGYNIVVPETVQAMADAFGPQDGDFQIRSMRAARDVNLVDVCQIVKHPECVPSFPPDTAYAPSPYNYLAVSGVVARFTESVTVLEAPERADAGGIA